MKHFKFPHLKPKSRKNYKPWTDKTVFFWESSTPTLICILTHWAMVSSGLRDQHMHTGLYYTWHRVFSLVYLLWVFGTFWCKRILSFKDNVSDDRVFISTVNAWPGYLVYFEKIELWIALHYSLPYLQLFYHAI